MKISKFKAMQMLGDIRQQERAAREETRDFVQRGHLSQACVLRDALKMHGWLIVVSQGVECGVEKKRAK